MTDILDTVKKALDDELPWNWGGDEREDVRALVAEVERLREVERKFASALPAWKAEEVVWRETEADLLRDLAALRQRHAEAVDLIERCREWPEHAADKDTLPLGVSNYRVASTLLVDIDAWLASEAKARLT